MAYVNPNHWTKQGLREAVEAGEIVTVFEPGGLGRVPEDGKVSVEGPHYPEPHRWYARVTLAGGHVVRVV